MKFGPYGDHHTTRGEVDPVGRRFFGHGNQQIIDAEQQIAERRSIPMAKVALAGVLHNPIVAAPIVGATKPHHLPDAVAALDVHLTDKEIAALHNPYTPQRPPGSDPQRATVLRQIGTTGRLAGAARQSDSEPHLNRRQQVDRIRRSGAARQHTASRPEVTPQEGASG